jgi:DNA-binding transcriptional LysR family regulator
MTDIGEAVFVPRLATAFAREAPAATLRTVLMSSGDTAQALARGEVDLAIGFLPELKGDWHQQRLFEQRYVCLAAAGHPAWKRRAAAPRRASTPTRSAARSTW